MGCSNKIVNDFAYFGIDSNGDKPRKLEYNFIASEYSTMDKLVRVYILMWMHLLPGFFLFVHMESQKSQSFCTINEAEMIGILWCDIEN